MSVVLFSLSVLQLPRCRLRGARIHVAVPSRVGLPHTGCRLLLSAVCDKVLRFSETQQVAWTALEQGLSVDRAFGRLCEST